MRHMWTSKPTYVPLLWVLGPLVLGIICARYFEPWPYSLQVGSAALCAGVGLVVYYLYRCSKILRISLAAIAFIIFWSYAQLRSPAKDPRPWAPAREVVLQLDIQHCYACVKNKQRGVGRITQANPPLGYLVGQKVIYHLIGQAVSVGQQWQARGVIEHIKQDAFGQSMQLRGIYYTLKRGHFEACVQQAPAMDRVTTWAQQYLACILRTYIGPVPPSSVDTYLAMMLGKTSQLSLEQKQVFSLSGTLHLFAISGLHIAVIAGFLFGCLKRLPLSECIRVCIGLLIIMVYVVITGGAPSAWRAFWMVALFWIGIALQRQTTPFGILTGVATGALLYSPKLLWNIGFELSYMVVAGIILYGVPLAAYWEHLGTQVEQPGGRQKIGVKFKRYLKQAIAITLAANMASMPLIITHFGFFCTIGFALNVLLVPCASIAIILGFLSLPLSIVGLSWIAAVINTGAIWLLWALEQIIHYSLKIPNSTFALSWPASWGCFVLMGLGLIWLKWPPRPGAVWRFWLTPAWCVVGLLGTGVAG